MLINLRISEPLLNRFERGAEKIPASLLWYVAVFLEQDIDTFFCDILPEKNNRIFKLPETEPTFLEEK